MKKEKKNKILPTSGVSLERGVLESNPGKFEKFNKNKNQKRILIGSIIGMLLIIGGITLYKTFALYEEKKEFNVLDGKVPEVETEIIAMINNSVVEEIPKKGTGYIVDAVTCENGVEAEWANSTWNLTNIKNPNKILKKVCQVNFTKIPNKTIKVEARVNTSGPIGGFNSSGECTGVDGRIGTARQTIDVSNYTILEVTTTWNHWVSYGCGGTHRASISPLGYSASYFENSTNGGGTISTKTYNISNINSITVSAESTATGDTYVSITLRN